jgi:anti-anti-sigma regulatory factor
VSAKNQGASLKLSNLGTKFQEVLQITKLVTIFEVCDTEAAAVASFSR